MAQVLIERLLYRWLFACCSSRCDVASFVCSFVCGGERRKMKRRHGEDDVEVEDDDGDDNDEGWVGEDDVDGDGEGEEMVRYLSSSRHNPMALELTNASMGSNDRESRSSTSTLSSSIPRRRTTTVFEFWCSSCSSATR